MHIDCLRGWWMETAIAGKAQILSTEPLARPHTTSACQTVLTLSSAIATANHAWHEVVGV